MDNHNSRAEVRKKRIPLAGKILKQIEAEIKRTRVSPTAFFGAEEYTGSLTFAKIDGWRSGRTKTALKRDLEEFFQIWRDLPLGRERVPLTPDMIAELHDERDRTGVSVTRLLKVSDRPREEVSASTISNWLTGACATVILDHFDHILSLWRALPSNPYIEITDEVHAQLIAEVERTGIGPVALFRGVRPSHANGLRSSLVASWLSGKTKTAQKLHLDFVMQRWRSLPDQEANWLPVEKAHIEHVREELRRTGVSQVSLVRSKDDAPDGLTFPVFRSFLHGKLKCIRRDHYSYLVSSLEKLPDRQTQKRHIDRKEWHSEGYIELTDKMLSELRSEQERTGVPLKSLTAIMRSEGDTDPPKPAHISAWLTGRRKWVPQDDFDAVLKAIRALPDCNAFFKD